MSERPRSELRVGTAEESNYHVLLNSLTEVDIQLRALNVPSESREILMGLIELGQAHFQQRFRAQR